MPNRLLWSILRMVWCTRSHPANNMPLTPGLQNRSWASPGGIRRKQLFFISLPFWDSFPFWPRTSLLIQQNLEKITIKMLVQGAGGFKCGDRADQSSMWSQRVALCTLVEALHSRHDPSGWLCQPLHGNKSPRSHRRWRHWPSPC